MAARPLLAVLSLLLLPLANAQTNPSRGDVRLVVLSDFNGAYGSTRYPRAVAKAISDIVQLWKPDLFVSAGDVVAGQSGALPPERFAMMWSAFDREVAAPLRKAGIPYALAIGNHDGSSLRTPDGGYLFARERRAAAAYWRQPMYAENLAYQDHQDFPFHYSFLFHGLFFVVIDASSAQLGEAQTAWLETQLARPAAQAAALRIVVGHLPLYAVSGDKNKPGEVLAQGDALRRLLERYDVDLYVSGHHAAYYLGHKGELDMLFSGGIGARRLLGSDASPRSTVTLADIFLSTREIRFTTFDAFTGERIALDSLPARVSGFSGTIVRRDLAEASPLADVRP
ncbi:MAG TPA: metallophosphoesterase [Trueperaceae bacterium]